MGNPINPNPNPNPKTGNPITTLASSKEQAPPAVQKKPVTQKPGSAQQSRVQSDVIEVQGASYILDRGFKLYLATNLASPHFPAEV